MTKLTGQTYKNNINNAVAEGRLLRVLIAEDSATIRHHLVSVIDEVPGMEVVGQAKDGLEALALVAELKPDVISMDIRMPHLDGLEATRRIMMENPTPVVVVSGLVEQDIELSFQALRAGALAVVEKPPDRNNPEFAEKQQHLIKTLVAMAGVTVVRRGQMGMLSGSSTSYVVETPAVKTGITPEVIAIGASAGGPSALSKLLGEFPEDMPVPIVVVQHISQEFVLGLARWLDKNIPLRVQVAKNGTVLEAGVVNLAPSGVHMKVVRKSHSLVVMLTKESEGQLHQPSVDVLFESVVDVCGSSALGLILTGMGNDGASGLLKMRQAGARTLVQDKESSTVFGMPAAAIECKAAEQIKSLADLPLAVLKLL